MAEWSKGSDYGYRKYHKLAQLDMLELDNGVGLVVARAGVTRARSGDSSNDDSDNESAEEALLMRRR